MWNKCKVILLAGESKPLYDLRKFEKVISLYKSKHPNVKPRLDLVTSMMGIKVPNVQHLYIISENKIKAGDWFYHEFSKLISNNYNLFVKGDKHIMCCKKIIATTSPELHKDGVAKIGLPFIEQYITDYNKGNIIVDVLVEYEGYKLNGMIDESTSYEIKINKNNTINIKTVKDNFSRDEVIELFQKYQYDCVQWVLRMENDIEGKPIPTEWIKQNL